MCTIDLLSFRSCVFTILLAGLCLVPARGFAQEDGGTPLIAFVSVSEDGETTSLRVTDPGGVFVTELVTGGFFSDPIWSPDGRQLAFIGQVRRNDDPALWLMNSDGTHLHAVLEDGRTIPEPLCASWSPDGTQLLFSAETGIGGYYFYTVNVDGSELERLRFQGIPSGMEGVAGDIVSPCAVWSPDGSQIAVLGRGDGFPPGQLYVTNAEGSVAAAFPATTTEGVSFHQLRWSPDGVHAIVNVIPGLATMQSEPMAVTSADGSVVEARIGAPPNLSGSAAWSPDSQQIVFVANEQGVESMPGGDLWMANSDGSGVRTLGIEVNVLNRGTSWGLIPAGIVLPAVPVSLAEAAG